VHEEPPESQGMGDYAQYTSKNDKEKKIKEFLLALSQPSQ
jgi:hypothetical protein